MGDASSPWPAPVSASTPGPSGLPSPNPTQSFWQTSHPNALAHHRSTPSLPTKVDVVVIGTGISGTFAVNELLSSPSSTGSDHLSVLALEARTLCSAATGRNGGHLQPLIHSAHSGIIDFELRNFRHVESLIASNGIQCDFRRVPGALGFWNGEFFEAAKRELAGSERGHRDLVSVVEGRDHDRLTTLGLKGGVKGAIVQTLAATLSPYKLVVALWGQMLDEFEAHGRLNLQTETPVSGVEKVGDGWLLWTPRGAVTATHVVVATNAYTSHLIPLFGRLISPTQAQMSALLPPAESRYRKVVLAKSYGFVGVQDMDSVMSDYLVQNPLVDAGEGNGVVGSGGHLMFGGGRHKALNHGEGVWQDDYVDQEVERYLRSLPERLDLDTGGSSSPTEAAPLDIVASWTGIIGSSVDGHPWVGGVPDTPGLFVCAGYSGHGMTNAPLCGRYTAQLVRATIEGTPWGETDEAVGRRNEGIRVPKEYLINRERIERGLDNGQGSRS